MKLSLPIITLTGLGVYMATSSKKQPTLKSTYEFTCNSLKINTDYQSFLKSLVSKLQKLLKERNINRDNVLVLTETQIIDLSKYWIYNLNPVCTKIQDVMSEVEKQIYLILSSILIFLTFQASLDISALTWPLYEKTAVLYLNTIQKYLQTNYTTEQVEEFIKQLQKTQQFPN